jgi:hypothetical protein
VGFCCDAGGAIPGQPLEAGQACNDAVPESVCTGSWVKGDTDAAKNECKQKPECKCGNGKKDEGEACDDGRMIVAPANALGEANFEMAITFSDHPINTDSPGAPYNLPAFASAAVEPLRGPPMGRVWMEALKGWNCKESCQFTACKLQQDAGTHQANGALSCYPEWNIGQVEDNFVCDMRKLTGGIQLVKKGGGAELPGIPYNDIANIGSYEPVFDFTVCPFMPGRDIATPMSRHNLGTEI